jgi:glutamate racemase
MRMPDAAIGVFDSGVGGLTVLRSLHERLPRERFIYLGDTARLPYGTKSPESIRRYSIQAAGILRDRGIKCLVVACNTASAVALETLREHFAPLPVLGVLEPGAVAACRASRNGRIAVIATEGTVRGGAYQAAIRRCRPDAQVLARACPLFVALAEEGWIEGEIVEAVAHRYLDGLFHGSDAPDTLVLGCTHFPVFAPVLSRQLGPGVTIVDSARTTAQALAELLADRGLEAAPTAAGCFSLLATDGPERFARVGSIFLGRAVAAADVELVDIAPQAA